MGFLDKVVNRVDAAAKKAGKVFTEAAIKGGNQSVRESIHEGLLSLAAYSTTGDRLQWLSTGPFREVVGVLIAHGEKMQHRGVDLDTEDALPDPSDILEKLTREDEDVTAVAAEYRDSLSECVEQIVDAAADAPLAQVSAPGPVEGVIAMMSDALSDYRKTVVEWEQEVEQARTDLEKKDAEYAAMGETISEEVSRRGREAASIANKQLDVLSGKEVLAVVQARLDLQDRYNDILATKLEEALTRIDVLEQRLRDDSED